MMENDFDGGEICNFLRVEHGYYGSSIKKRLHKKILGLYPEYTQTEIARIVGCCRKSVYNHLKAAGLI